jgi:hypothetical protein
VVEALRRLRLEIDALLSAVRADSHAFITGAEVLRRIEQLFLSWSSFRGALQELRVPVEVLDHVDRLFTVLTRLAASRSRKEHYIRALLAIRRSLTGTLLPEIARLAEPLQTGRAATLKESLIPEIPDVSTELITNALFGWKDHMRRFLRQSNFDQNVFVMVAYRQRLAKLISATCNTLEDMGLNAVVAREHRLTDDLYNPIACLLCCRYGVAIFDRGEAGQTHNPNIVYELAIMTLLKRPCIILKHTSLQTMPSDFLQRLYEDYRTTEEACQKVASWWKTTSGQQ